jgi:hypothetical protein
VLVGDPKTNPTRRCQVKLSEFNRSGSGARTRFVARVTDAASEEEFELTIAGPGALVKRMLGDADIDLTIDSRRTQDQVLAEFGTLAQDQRRQAMWEVAGLEDTGNLLKPAPEPPDPKTTVFAAVRPVVGAGTPFALTVTGFFVPRLFSFFFFGSFVFTTVGSLLPATGDQDLFLHLFSPTGTTVSSSRSGGTSLDVVWFTFPFFPYVPVFEVQGFTAGVCGTFAAHGA